MTISNNLNSMNSSELQLNQMASNIAQVADAIGDPEFQEVSTDLINSIIGQIPEVVSYQANAQNIQTQNAVSDMLLNIKA
jgi:hypothetical protein